MLWLVIIVTVFNQYLQFINLCYISKDVYWREVSKFRLQSFSDQERVNSALKLLHVQWNPFDRSQVRELHSPIEGVCPNGLHITLLPQSIVCRNTCNSAYRGSYTVWHGSALKDGMTKKKKASEGHVWFLVKNWEESCKQSYLIKDKWLKCISNNLINANVRL